MCKEMPVIPINKVVDPKRIIGKNINNIYGSLFVKVDQKVASSNLIIRWCKNYKKVMRCVFHFYVLEQTDQ
jgi:hypothetical protein